MDNLTQFLNDLTREESLYFMGFIIGGFIIGTLFGLVLRGGALRRVRKALEKKEEEVIDLQGQLNAATQKLSLKETELNRLTVDAEESAQKIQIMESENSKLQKTVFHLNSEYDKLKSSGHSFESTFDDLNNQIIGYKSQNEQLAQQLEEAIKAKEYAEKKLDSIANSNFSVAGDTGEGEGELVAVEAPVAVYNNGAEANARLNSLEEKLEQLITVNESLRMEVEALKAKPREETQPIANHGFTNPPIPPKIDRSTVSDPYFPQDGADLAIEEPFTPSEEPEVITPTPVAEPIIEDKSTFADKVETEDPIERDNLTLIEGIGPFLERKLNENGIFTYEQIGTFDDRRIEEVTKDIQFFEGRIKKDDWVGQAKSLYQIKIQNPKAFELMAQNNEIISEAPELMDDLKVIEGIGPKVEQLLKDAGFINLTDIAAAAATDLQEILDKAGSNFRLQDASTWPAQARLAVNGDWDLLEEYQQKLKGGKEVTED